MAAVASQIQRGIQLSKVSPAFLHANSTSHTWAFSAFAELIDNAYDPDVSASELLIDKLEINGHTCLIFLDNGAGMDTEKLLKMLSFGFCDKHMYERTTSHQPIGHYGNGFKSGSMRLAKDALVFTRCHSSASIGFLSQTYLKAIEADSVFIPIVTYRLPKLERIKSEQSRNNLNAILKHSVFRTEQDLKEELYALEGSMTGTKIILSNLRRLQGGTLELDFSSDETDIRCPEAHEVDLTSVYHRPVQLPLSEYKHSLREYCSILFLRPRMKITIRLKRVRSKLISKSLSNTEIDSYKPTWLGQPLKITFGFTCQKTKTEDYGMMLYHRNRLIKAFEKVGYQKQPNDLGIGVVGVAQVDFLQPTHNKQDFNKDEKFNSVMMAFANKLNDYWNEKKQSTPASFTSERAAPDWLWAQCEICLKWRRLPDGFNKDSLPDQWFCRINPDATHNRCEIPEEPEDEDLAVRASYVKTFKKKKEQNKRQELMEKHRQDMERQMKQRVGLTVHHKPLEISPAVNNLQRALAEAQQREEEQKRLIMQMEEEKKRIEAQLEESLKGPKSKGRNQNAMGRIPASIGSMAPEYSGTMTPQNKRKNVSEPAKSAKIPRSNAKDDHHVNSNKSNNYANSSSKPSSALKVQIGGLINKDNKSDGPNKKNSSFSSKKKGSSSSLTPTNETFVDLTEDMDYEITLNEDYESDEDVKPDVKQLNGAGKEKKKKKKKRKEKETESEKDVKPDKDALDRETEKSVAVTDKQPSSTDAVSDIKEELHEKETAASTTKDTTTPQNETTATASTNKENILPEKENKEATRSSENNSPTNDNDNDDEGGFPSLDDHESDNDGEGPSEDVLSSNVNKVMAALENQFKKSQLKKNKESNDDNDSGDNSSSSGRKELEDCENENDSSAKSKNSEFETTEKEGKDAQKDDVDLIEICSDDEEADFNCNVVEIKKEIEEDTEKKKAADAEKSGDPMETESEEQLPSESSKVARSVSVDEGVTEQVNNGLQTGNENTAASSKSSNDSPKRVVGDADDAGTESNDVLENDELSEVLLPISDKEATSYVLNADGDSVITNVNDSSKERSSSNISDVKSRGDSEASSCSILNADQGNVDIEGANPSEGDSDTEMFDCKAKEGETERKSNEEDVDVDKNEHSNEADDKSDGSEINSLHQDVEMVNNDDSEKEMNREEENESESDSCDVNKDKEKQKDNTSADNCIEMIAEKQSTVSTESNSNTEKHKEKSDETEEAKQSSVEKENITALNENCSSMEMSNEKDKVNSKKDTFDEGVGSKGGSPVENVKEDNNDGEDSYVSCSDVTIQDENNLPPSDENLTDNSVHDDSVASDVCNDNDVISKGRFQGFLKNVHHLLSLLCPDADLGNVQDTEQTVATMIQIHLEGTQSQTQSTEAEES